MAKVKSPLQSANAVGSLGGVTFSIHRGTQCARERSKPTNPQSARQLTVRANQSTNSKAWAGLTAGQRAGWATFAAAHPGTDVFGNPQSLSGFNYYCAFSALLLDMGFAAVATAPAVAGPSSVAGITPTPGSGQVSFAYTAHSGTATQLDIWGYGPHSAGRTPGLAQAKHLVYAPGETTPKVVTGLSAGTWTFWLRFISETDGQWSPMVKVSAVVT